MGIRFMTRNCMTLSWVLVARCSFTHHPQSRYKLATVQRWHTLVRGAKYYQHLAVYIAATSSGVRGHTPGLPRASATHHSGISVAATMAAILVTGFHNTAVQYN